MKYITFLLCMLFSVASYAKLKINDFKGAKIYLNTATDLCKYCETLENSLQSSDSPNSVTIKISGVDLDLEIVRLDHSDDDEKIATEAKRLGFLIKEYPRIKIIDLNGEILSNEPVFPGAAVELDVNENDSIEDYRKAYRHNFLSFKGFKNKIKSHILDLIGSKEILSTNDRNPEFIPFAFKTNVMIAGTAMTPLDNAAFTGLSIKSISQKLDKINAPFPFIFYGSGRGKSKDTVILQGNEKSFVKIAGVNAQATFRRDNLASFFYSTNEAEAINNLLIFVGHGTSQGSHMWSEDPLRPSELTSLNNESKSQNILVSGNCFGGVMANSIACGFFGATPHVLASGCWEGIKAGKGIQDYTKVYFNALEDTIADINDDGKISFSEAHTYAIINGEIQDTPYSSADALVEDYFTRTKSPINKTPTLSEIRTLVEAYGDEEDKHLLTKLAPKSFDNSIKVLNDGEKPLESPTFKVSGVEFELKRPKIDNKAIKFSSIIKQNLSNIRSIKITYFNSSFSYQIKTVDKENNLIHITLFLANNNDYASKTCKTDEHEKIMLKINEYGKVVSDCHAATSDKSTKLNIEFITKLRKNKKLNEYLKSLNLNLALQKNILDDGNLYQLYKRMMYKALTENNYDENEKFSKIRACETQNIIEFLNP